MCLETILEPLYTLQKMSESNSATAQEVYPRQQKIESHLRDISQRNGQQAQEIQSYLDRSGSNSFSQRRSEQLLPIHLAAYILDPTNYNAVLSDIDEERLKTFVREQIGVEEEHSFYQYRKQEGVFTRASNIWEFYTQKPYLFQSYVVS